MGESSDSVEEDATKKEERDAAESPPPASPKVEPTHGSLFETSSSVPASPDVVSNTSSLVVDGLLFHRIGAQTSATSPPSLLHSSLNCTLHTSPPSSTPTIILDLVPGRGRAGDVYSDSTGLLAVKLIEPREDDVYNALYDSDACEAIRRYESRLQEAIREVAAYQKLQACRFVPAFYGCFERVDEDSYRNLMLVMERVAGNHIAEEDLPKLINMIEYAVRAVHRYGVLHGDVRPANILLAQYKIVLVDFGRSRLDPDASQAEMETSRVRYLQRWAIKM
ncbi:serine/threonine-protein kinase-like protein [Rhodotorula toruloides]|uniref:Serine/threonine-protein kinase-like protein n=1 Tax=Rhodotorula toruloides TaxID=5286 RepID=A0A511KR06_RHOTO|nr:serine/threonine-protein kinase-like protein [Rhodotorula toruloides]